MLQKGFYKSFKNRIAVSKVKKKTLKDNFRKFRQSINVGAKPKLSNFTKSESKYSIENNSRKGKGVKFESYVLYLWLKPK